MALPASKVDIANMALDFLGHAPPVSNIDSPVTDTEKLLARHFDACRQELLRDNPWNFATKHATIARNTVAPAFDYEDAYDLPNDWVRTLSVEGDSIVLQSRDFTIAGRQIWMNNGGGASIKLRYVADIEDITTWDAKVRKLLALYVAAATGFQITKKEKVVERVENLIKIYMPAARSIDGQEVPPRRIQRSKYRDARVLFTNRVDATRENFD